MEFAGKTVLVTGAASGIGRATVEAFLDRGAQVHACDVSGSQLQNTFGDVDRVRTHVLDVADSSAVTAAFARVDDEHGKLDVLVNAAGVNTPSRAAAAAQEEQNARMVAALGNGEQYHSSYIEATTDEDFDRAMRINLYGQFYAIRAAVPLMRAAGAGAIVNFSSAAALDAVVMPPYYPASKAAVLGLTREVAAELAPYGITCNAVAPGAVDTPLLHAAGPDLVAMLTSIQPIKRLASPQEIAATVVFLSSAEASYYTGQTFSPSGGLVTH